MNTSLIAENWSRYLSGAILTIELLIGALIIGLMIAIIAATMQTSNNRLYRGIANTYSYVFRGTPLLLQLYLFYYGVGLWAGQIDGIRDTFAWNIVKEAWVWALIAFALNTGAYTCEILRGAIVNTPEGELEAGKAFGMTRPQIYRRLILPSAIRRALPAYGNEVIYTLHGTALAATVTLFDITGVAKDLFAKTYDPFSPYIFAAVLYLIITMLIVFSFKQLEKRYLKHLGH